MVILRAESIPGERESNPPISGAPALQLLRSAPRIDNAESQVRSVCVFCNSFKGSDISGIDPKTGKLTALYNPRRHKWTRHFYWQDAHLIGHTAVGRVTITVLRINDPFRVELREMLIEERVFPPRQ